ncbi:hypothetical protein L1987_12087 [Smallanthus sonchifolius]|uniref:Uncharacterized protein n=1 Tax=Smallanthus sonchifolius TaxID=185202 RepID=A0ACB9JF40_9ASTR|nr:hypothetical protein L1987_12087 [Smallanthus sonchifolius]
MDIGLEGEIAGGGNWFDVVNRRNRRRNLTTKAQGKRRITPGIITFFVSNLPEDVSEKGLTEVFSEQGRVGNVYVARKRDSLGNIFAFVRFSGVKDIVALEKSLKEVKLGFSKPFVRLTKFEVGGKKVNQAVMVKEKEGISFRDVLDGNNSRLEKLPVVTVEAKETVMAKLVRKASLLGRASNLQYLCSLHNLMKQFKDGPDIRYVSEMHVLLTFRNKDTAMEFLNTHRLVWKEWFSDLQIWEEQPLAFERIAWIRVYGVLVQLWDKETFNVVGRRYGKIVRNSCASWNDVDLSHEVMGILVNHGKKIREEITLRYKSSRSESG